MIGGVMFGVFRKGALLDAELAGWQFDCFEWLLRHGGGVEAFRQRRLILPTPQFFPHDGSRGHAFAEMIFHQVKAHADMADWPCKLESQENDPDTMVSPQAFVQGAPNSPGGTFRALKEGGALITYNPSKLRDPMSLVATFAHELAHYRMATFPEQPPGGQEVREPATDLAAVFMGFGIFLANSRFNFSHFDDGRTAGWRWQQQGYLSDVEVLHMHAIFSVMLGIDQRETLPHLKSALRGIFKRVHKDVMRNEEVLKRLNNVTAATIGDIKRTA
ncbi:hypothetical protein [Dyella psychrodurans]|uniref:Uncharacterized protein n=1 Tax=Dyella psychrodurans TaxID=1927960 RepID=A0A370WUR2_9GAMM|nr:hypothetical protein [Dyella psychrodurans]RDS79801.1 hypothetical protein DWU99_20605 [Dyella psychrodurans]